MKIGIFGGTFNPVHNGHVNIAKFYQEELGLDKLFIIPSNIPPHKNAPDLLDKVDRYNVCRLAFSHVKNAEVLDIEIRQEGKIRTIDTLNKLKAIYGKDTEYYLIIGGDLFKTFDEWVDYKTLYRTTTLCVGARSKEETDSLKIMKSKIEEDGAKVILSNLPVIDISSTEIRERLKNNKDVSENIDEKVYRYIKTLGLYETKESPVLKYQELVKTILKTDHRKEHSFNVGKEALTLGILNGVDAKTIYIAGILHDILKETKIEKVFTWPGYFDIISKSEVKNFKPLWHGYLGATYIEKNLKELPKTVPDMVRFHPTSRVGATLEEKIIYLADLIEFCRDYEKVDDIRKETKRDFQSGYEMAVFDQIKHLVIRKKAIAPISIDVYNDIILN